MKILIDGHMLGAHEGGNERYAESLVKSISRLAKIGVIVSAKQSSLKGVLQHISGRSNLMRYLWEIPSYFWQGKYDLVITTYFASPLIARRNVIIVHDMLPYRRPDFFPFRERVQFLMLGWSIRHCAAILVPTQFVKNEIASFYPNLVSKIFITSEAAAPIFHRMSEVDRKRLKKKHRSTIPSVLVFGSKLEKRPLKPVLVALSNYPNKIRVYILQKPQKYRVVGYPNLQMKYLKNLSDRVLSEYYNFVDAIIYPSIYEGFGLPVIEAMKSGVPVITTKISPIRELAKTAAYYINLDDEKSIISCLESVLNDGTKRAQKIDRGYTIASKYSWSKTAKSTLAALSVTMEKL